MKQLSIPDLRYCHLSLVAFSILDLFKVKSVDLNCEHGRLLYGRGQLK